MKDVMDVFHGRFELNRPIAGARGQNLCGTTSTKKRSIMINNNRGTFTFLTLFTQLGFYSLKKSNRDQF